MEDPLLELKTPTLFVIGSHSTLTSQEEVEVRLLVNSIASPLFFRLFTVLYFSVRSSRSSALRHGLSSCLRVKTTSVHIHLKFKAAIINGNTRYISTISRKNRGLWTVFFFLTPNVLNQFSSQVQVCTVWPLHTQSSFQEYLNYAYKH